MITFHFHLQPQYKYELFHINFTIFVHVDLDSIRTILRVLNDFKQHSGLEINTIKTEAMWLCEWKGRTHEP